MISSAFRWLGRNLGTLLLAFALATVVWVSSVVAADPNIDCPSPTRIPIEIIGQDPSMQLMEALPENVSIQFFAPRSVCELLDSTTVSDAVVDLTGLGGGEHLVSVQPPVVAPDVTPVRIVDYSPKEVTVSLERLVTESFSIDLMVTGEPALGFQAGRPALEPEEIMISGPESAVSLVDRVTASTDISGAREDISRNLSVRVLNESGASATGVEIVPTTVKVDIPIEQLGRYRDVAVQVKTEGQWARGYRLTNITVSPPTVTVFSVDPQLVSSLPGFVETFPIDLTDASDDVEASVELVLPEGVSLVGRETVFVQVGIAAIEGNLVINLPVEIIGLNPELEASVSPENVDVILFGPLPVLETLTPENIRVVVDVTGLDEGTWQLIPLVDILPDEVQEDGINPGIVEVILAPPPTPTPVVTPTPS
ncbi:MAG: CdaR family protein [Anaerolineales bacterium]|nr:CdaR family protein [Anaerolineales bacterium]